jgi:hypothetical protein
MLKFKSPFRESVKINADEVIKVQVDPRATLPPLLPKILSGLALLLVALVIVLNLPGLASKTTALVAIPYADTSYIQREEDLLGAEVPALKFTADNTGPGELVAWVSADYQSRKINVRYWLYPRPVWLSDNLQQAATQKARVILALKSCPATCTTAEIAAPLNLDGYRVTRQFAVRDNVVSVLTRVG